MRKNKNKSFKKGAAKYAFVIDGDNESWYIDMLKRNEGIRAKVSPEIPDKKNIPDQFDMVEELAADYQKVFWIIDLDVPIRENKINELKDYLSKISAKSSLKYKVVPIVNTPCLEFWYLLHLKHTSKYFDSCKKVESEIKRIAKAKNISALKDYEKSQIYYTKQGNDIYLRLKPYLKTAISNAKKLPPFNPENYEMGLSEIDELFKHIKELNYITESTK